ncbi:MAG: DUF3160 domain-containing protein, partial [Candidatus Aegiribacteria sp.]|nr:DUF3160 domain-containing protein [Candidatus Aegiribacteria sp.]MBD3295056.1 DUF3160 domain-containing protein [Candidatus Fermentibacteria bacterium]
MRLLLTGVLVLLLMTSVSCTEGGNGMVLSHSLQGEELDFSANVSVTASFAGLYYEPVEYSSEPDMGGLSLPVDSHAVINLSEVLDIAEVGETPWNLLMNGFAVFRPTYPTDDPLEAFRSLNGWDQPIYVSSGIPLHMLHIFFDQILQDLEEKYFFTDLKAICDGLYSVNIDRGSTLNASFFAVAAAILDPSFVPDESIADEVEEELALIEAHSGFSGSPVMGYREDYSQYVPRGHYASSDTLRRYFKAMMWLGRITFLLNGGDSHGQAGEFIVSEERAREMTASALFTVSDLATESRDGETLLQKWKRMYQITAFFAGFADDLSVPEYTVAARETGGETVTAETVIGLDFYRSLRDHLNDNYTGPGIYSGTGELVSMPDEQGNFDPQDLQRGLGKTAGFRFMGQRYTPDSEILGKLVFPAVGMNPQGRNRFMPSGLDVAAAFGSTAAESILEERGDFQYSGYADSLESLRRKVEDFGPEQW